MTELSCLVCHQQQTAVGALCRECARELRGAAVITPEQIVMRGSPTTSAALIDVWGRVHRLPAVTLIGRDFEGDGLLVLDSSISRAHASITVVDQRWLIRDLESANGTFIEETNVGGELALHDGDRVQLATVSLFFVEQVPDIPVFDATSIVGYTERSPSATTSKLDRVPPALPPLTLRLEEPSGGGGGLLAIEGKHVQLTVPQFEMLSLLIARMTEERDRGEHERGFVHLNELVARLSLDSSLPREDHIRQLVRRLRRALAKAGFESLIETRYGVGYRLRGTPRRS